MRSALCDRIIRKMNDMSVTFFISRIRARTEIVTAGRISKKNQERRRDWMSTALFRPQKPAAVQKEGAKTPLGMTALKRSHWKPAFPGRRKTPAGGASYQEKAKYCFSEYTSPGRRMGEGMEGIFTALG